MSKTGPFYIYFVYLCYSIRNKGGSMNKFIYDIPTKICFGKGQINRLAREIKLYSDSVLLIYGGGSIKKNGIYDSVIKILEENNISYSELSRVKPNPRLSSVKKGIKICKEKKPGLILAIGGGSIIDCSKAIAAGAEYNGDPWDFYSGKARVEKALPIGTILTLSATGSEMNGNSVVTNEDTLEKFGIYSRSLKPKFSILDPEFTYTVNEWQTASGTVDIFVHVCEQYFSPERDAFLQDRMSEAVMKTCIKYGKTAIEYPKDYEARANLMWAGSIALNGLLTYGKTGDWATHVIEHSVSAVYDVTHGAGLAVILPAWMEYVLATDTEAKFAEFGKNVFNILESDDKKASKKAIEKTKEFFKSLNMPSKLSELGVEKDKLDILVEKSMIASKLGFFKSLEKDDVRSILKSCF